KTPGYRQADPDAVAAYYRVHFRGAVPQTRHLDLLIERFRPTFSQGVLEARAIEDRLWDETWNRPGYDLLPALERLRVPTLVIHGDHDFVPRECSEHIARAIPGARLAVMDSGHFSYLERTEEVREIIREFFR